ncbi:hypothetical protein OV203_33260 [Nannocystis sp. ILAH1]|uniref:hypothetical protein n=1 Tax=unclassified Nannocystis TaxID=2627009 RepID=UPI0022714721|nr:MULTISPECIES: hypothetical protein [unclassified Nannocystis]MCY0992055.1 hypothetical protein [Nannocystis sp. ILAH1]MCY1064303.1 hypothetical protein [Nannocystis sp. RBIL2]
MLPRRHASAQPSLLDQWTVEFVGEPVALLRVADDRLVYTVGTRAEHHRILTGHLEVL